MTADNPFEHHLPGDDSERAFHGLTPLDETASVRDLPSISTPRPAFNIAGHPLEEVAPIVTNYQGVIWLVVFEKADAVIDMIMPAADSDEAVKKGFDKLREEEALGDTSGWRCVYSSRHHKVDLFRAIAFLQALTQLTHKLLNRSWSDRPEDRAREVLRNIEDYLMQHTLESDLERACDAEGDREDALSAATADPEMFMAVLETRGFEFTGVGLDAEQAMDSLRKGWNKHRTQTGAAPWEEIIKTHHIQEISVLPGECLRDSEVLES